MSSSTRLGVRAALVAGEIVPGDVCVVEHRIDAVGVPAGRHARGMAVPGFVDWQVNGFGGVHFGDADEAGYLRAAQALAGAGIVWSAPTLLSMDLGGYVAALEQLGAVRAAHPSCGFTGGHLEGPFLSPRWSGAHRGSTFVLEEAGVALDRLLAAGPVSMITLAPEQPGVAPLVRGIAAAGVVVAVGHSDATIEVCRAAGDAGASAITHCWNAHRRFAPRDPGPAGWALSTPSVVVGLIADGVHVAPEVLALTFGVAGARVALTTDAIAPAGTAATSWSLEGREVTVAEGAARLADRTLAGSVATPSSMLRVLERTGVAFEDAVHALSAPQAGLLGLGQWCVRPGDPAHVTVLDDDHGVLQTWRSGVRVA